MTDGLGLEDAYGATLERIKAQGSQKSRLGMAALMWVCHSERPLRAEELCHALAVQTGSTDCNADSVSSIRTVLSCCQGLIVVDKEGSAVRLVHSTLQEYLTSHPDFFRSPHAVITETCLAYLNSPQVMALPTSGPLSSQHTPFLGYSAIHWGVHMKKEPTDRGKALALRLFSHYERHISIKILLGHTLLTSVGSVVDSYKFTGLHCACMFGLVELASALTRVDGVDINRMDDTHTTPLIWAVRNGHELVVKVLLSRGDINPNLVGDFGRAPISWAAKRGHEAMAKLLLAHRDVDPDVPDYFGRRPISWAAEHGHEAVVRLLLGRDDVDPNKPDNSGRTPILWAAKWGDEAVVRLLLGRDDVNPDRPDSFGRAPISWAAERGHEAVARQLLGREDVDPDVPDDFGRTPILWAAKCGDATVVRLLLGRYDLNPDKPDGFGRAPISWAADNGHEAVVKLLLGRKDVSPDRPDNRGRIPIFRAAENGHEVVVKLLLAREDVNLVMATIRS